MANKTRDLTLDALKGIAIFLVMVGHVLNLNHMEDPYLYDGIKAVQMPLFMIVSGYLCGMGRKVTNLKEYGIVLKKRAISYLVPFFVWIVVIYPTDIPGAIINTLFHLDYGLWFLMTLFILTVMVYTAQLLASQVSARLGENHPRMWHAIFFGTYALMAIFVLAETFLGWEFLSPALTRLYIPFYMAGYLVTAYRPSFENGIWGKKAIKLASVILAAGVFAWLVIGYDLVDLSSISALGRQVLASFAGCYVIFFLCRKWKDGKTKAQAAWLGGFTLEIYALHFHFATLLHKGQGYQLYTWQGIVFAFVSFVVMSALTAGIIWATKKVWILDFLLYGKQKKKLS